MQGEDNGRYRYLSREWASSLAQLTSGDFLVEQRPAQPEKHGREAQARWTASYGLKNWLYGGYRWGAERAGW